MKGAVFIALQEMIVEKAGLEVWHNVLDAAGNDGVFTATMNYDDAELMALVGAVCDTLDMSAVEAQRLFGHYLFGFLHRGHPIFADSKPDFFSFIESIGGVIHLEVVKLDEQARPPKIDVSLNENGTANLTCFSERKLCYLAEGLLNGAAEHFGIKIKMDHFKCMHDGHECCEFLVEHEQS